MKKYFLFFVAAASIISCDVRRKDKVADDASTLMEAVMKDSTTVQLIDSLYNFGTIKEGEKAEYSFRFRNSGNKPMIITSSSATCGCTIPEKPEKPVMPGSTGVIKVVFNSTGKLGHQEKVVTVTANVKPAFPGLKLTGEVTKKDN